MYKYPFLKIRNRLYRPPPLRWRVKGEIRVRNAKRSQICHNYTVDAFISVIRTFIAYCNTGWAPK